MNRDADRVAKTAHLPLARWIADLARRGLCSLECQEALTQARPQFVPVHADEIKLPEEWQRENPGLGQALANGLQECLPEGVLRDVHQALIDTLYDLCVLLTSLEQGGDLVNVTTLDEKRDFQPRIRNGLRDREVPVVEAEELNGGELDLRVRERLIIENKVLRERTAEPFTRGPHFAWQARRYALPICSNITFVVVAYQPASEAAVLPLSGRIRVIRPVNSPPGYAQIRVVIPFGHGLPHEARTPG
jgi:hypothetical protein